MDTITQFLLGGAVAHATCGKPLGRKAFFIGGVLGTLPDLDVLVNFGNDLNNFIYHRSFSHSFFVLTLFSGLLYFFCRRYFNTHPVISKISHLRLFLFIYLPLVTHPLLDGFTIYGTQLFWPLFTDLAGRSPESWSTVFIIDPLFTVPLLIAFFVLMFKSRFSAFSSLSLFVACSYLVWGIAAKTIVANKITDYMKDNFSEEVRFFSTPTPFNTLLWRVVVMEREHHHVTYFSLLDLNRKIEIDSFKNNIELTTQSDPLSLDKLNWFTDGFYMLEKRDEKIVASDIRMGAEGAYVFRFVVGEGNAETGYGHDSVKTEFTPYRLKEEMKFDRLKGIFDKF